MHSSATYLPADYWTQLSDCMWRYLEGQDSWRPVLMDAQRAIASAGKESILDE